MVKKLLGISFGSGWDKKLQAWSWLFLRVGAGLLMLLSHGWGKLVNFENIAPNFFNFLGLGGSISLGLVVFSEFLGSLCLVFGFLTRWFSLSLAFTMFVAAFVVHGPDPFSKKELAVLYGLVFLCISLFGAGKYSVDSFLKSRLK